jgi:hypothetical protein
MSGLTPLYDEFYYKEDRNNPNNFFYKVKRNLLTQLEKVNFNGEELKLAGRQVFLTAMSPYNSDGTLRFPESEYDSDMDFSKDPSKQGVLLYLTDQNGSPFRFDENGKQTYDEGGKIAYYRMRSIPQGEITLNKYDINRIKYLAKVAYNGNEQAAKLQFIREMELIREMRNYVNKNKDNNIVPNVINGGTKGFIVENKKKFTLIKDLDLEGNAFNPKVEQVADESQGIKAGHTYFQVDGFYGQPVEVQLPEVAEVKQEDGSSFMDKLISILVDDIQDANGNKLLPSKRRELLELYINTGANSVQIYPKADGTFDLKLEGERLDISTDAAKQQAKQTLKDYFGTYKPRRVVTRQPERTIPVKESYDERDRYKVVEIDGVSYVIERPLLHVNSTRGALEGTINDISLTTNESETLLKITLVLIIF